MTTLSGRLVDDFKLRKTQSGISVGNFNLAVERKGTKEETDFIRCVAWRGTADLMEEYTTKGSPVTIVGSLQTSNFQNEQGQTVYVTEVNVDQVKFNESKQLTEQRRQRNQQGTQQMNQQQGNQNNSYGQNQQNNPSYQNQSNRSQTNQSNAQNHFNNTQQNTFGNTTQGGNNNNQSNSSNSNDPFNKDYLNNNQQANQQSNQQSPFEGISNLFGNEDPFAKNDDVTDISDDDLPF